MHSPREIRRLGDKGAACQPIPLLSSDIGVDDDGATMVVVFTRSTGMGGVVKPGEEISDAQEKFKTIFYHGGGEGVDGIPTNTMSAREYNEVVRSKFVQQLESNGMKASTFESVGSDEIFMKISLNVDGEVIRSLAERYNYLMPFTEDAYVDLEPTGGYPGRAPPTNSDGDQVPSYEPYKATHAAKIAGFRNVDEIRLLTMRLNSCANLAEMQSQQIVSRYFPAGKHGDVIELNEQFASAKRYFRLPNYEYLDGIRDYFGERMGFLFQWHVFFIRSLVSVAVAAGICAVRRLVVDFENRRYDQLAFAVFMVVWAVVYNQLFKNKASRLQQRWGMYKADVPAEELATYDASKNGTWSLWIKKKLGPVIMVAYSILFAYAVGYFNHLKTHDIQNGGGPFLKYEPLFVTGLIEVFSEVWEHVVGPLANTQNYRTQTEWDDAVAQIYAPISIFINLLPFFTVAFLTRYTSPNCGKTLEDAVYTVYGATGFPANTVAAFTKDENGTINGSTGLDFLDRVSYKDRDGLYCLEGCYPMECFPNGECVSSCIKSLESNLLVTFITNVASAFVFAVIPILLVKFAVRRDMRKAEDSDDDAAGKSYTYLQFQAKCYDSAPWKFRSWGGSHIDAFAGLASAFALITCFGMVLPVMSIIALFAMIILFHLSSYIKLNVMCRCFPAGAQGIGVWTDIFESIVSMAFICNAGLICFELDPIRNWPLWERFAAFVVIHNGCIVVRGFVCTLMPGIPEDVLSVDRFNTHFLTSLRKSHPLVLSAQEKVKNNLDISLGDGGSDSDEGTSASFGEPAYSAPTSSSRQQSPRANVPSVGLRGK